MARRQSGLIALTLGLLVAAQVCPGFRATASSPAEGHSLVASRSAQHAAIASNYGQLPLSFELNAGQTDPSVRFLTHGGGYSLFLTPNSAVMTLGGGADVPARHNALRLLSMPAMSTATQPAAVVGMRWLGANQHPVITGEQPLPGTVNYFIGNNPAMWRTNIPTYQQVRYHDVYPGIDLVYYGNQGQLEYDFVVAPGADPSPISLGFTGADRLDVDLLGNLSLTLPGGALQQAKPLIYQTMNGGRQTIAGGYALTGSGRVGFTLGGYNRSLPLVMDPVFHYSTYLGGSGGNGDRGYGVAVDSSGNAYITGATTSIDFPTTNPFQGSFGGGYSDAFVSKLNAAGTALAYSTYLGGSLQDYGQGIAVDGVGSAYITGPTFSGDFPTATPLQAINAGGWDAFVTKLAPSGGSLVYSTYLGGSAGEDLSLGIAIDGNGNAFVTGYTGSSNFPTTPGAEQTALAGNSDAFVSKLNAAGTALSYSTYLGGANEDRGYSITVNASGNAYVTGYTGSTSFPTSSPLQATAGGKFDAFVSQLNTSGSALVYSTYLGGSDFDYGYGIALDASGDAFITGTTSSTDFPTANPLQTSGSGFVTKVNASGTALVYSTYLDGAGSGIAIDSGGDAYVTGSTASTNFPTMNPIQASSGGDGDAFVSQLNVAGSALLFSTYLGGDGADEGSSIAVDTSGDIYLTGRTFSGDFPRFHALQHTYGRTYPYVWFTPFVTQIRPQVPTPQTTTGVFRPSNGNLYLKNSNTTGVADITLDYGLPGDLPVTGDWTGKGYPSIGIYRNGTFYLRNSNTTGFADIVVPFGASGDIPVAGDWTRNGYDSIGYYQPSNSTFYLRNSNTSGPAYITARLGIAGDVPIVGDWTGKGFDSIGVFRPSNGIVYLRNSNTTGVANISFVYGVAGDKPVVGDWDGNGTDTIGVDRNGRFLLRNSNTTGPASLSFYLGVSGDDPIAGPWLAPSSSPPPVHRGPSGGNTPTTRASSSAVAPRGRYTMP